jgi:hypothetical protein
MVLISNGYARLIGLLLTLSSLRCVHSLALPSTAVISSISSPSSTSSLPFSAHPTPSSRLHLDVSVGGESSIILDVSGLYGPGSWAGWFLTICGSWFGLIFDRQESRFDFNTWAYLLGVNGAAFYFARGTIGLRHALSAASDTQFDPKAYGNIGAPLTIVIWGIFHAFCQLVYLWHSPKSDEKITFQKTLTLVGGAIFPLLTLSICGVVLQFLDQRKDGNVPSNLIPALYYDGIRTDTHKYYLQLAWLAAFSMISAGLWLVLKLYFQTNVPGDAFLEKMQELFPNWKTPLFRFRYLSVIYPFWALMVVISGNSLSFKTILLYLACPSCILYGYFALPLAIVVGVLPIWSVVYVWRAYIIRASTISSSCFFMPCAPQSIYDEDQEFPLFGGLFLLLAGDVIPFIYKRWRKYQEQKAEADRELRAVENIFRGMGSMPQHNPPVDLSEASARIAIDQLLQNTTEPTETVGSSINHEAARA